MKYKNTALLGLIGAVSLSLILAACSTTKTTTNTSSKETGKTTTITIAEPVHSIGYLPLYAAMNEGYFADEGLHVEVITATGGAHVTCVVSGDAWGNIGGPESNAMANVGSKDPIKSVVNVVNRANVYLMADAKLQAPNSSDKKALAKFLEGKDIAAGRYGGSLNLLTRWLLINLGLNPAKDVQLEEPADATAVTSLVQSGKSQIANGAEPQIKDGIDKGVWKEPFYSFTDLGDYPYSVISVKQSTIEKDPKTVKAFVQVILKALKKINSDPSLAEKIAKKEFPTMDEKSMKAALDRAYKDKLWSKDGYISKESLAKPMDVVKKTGVFTKGYKYEDIVDMQFVKSK